MTKTEQNRVLAWRLKLLQRRDFPRRVRQPSLKGCSCVVVHSLIVRS
jgi:hypothetical protein